MLKISSQVLVLLTMATTLGFTGCSKKNKTVKTDVRQEKIVTTEEEAVAPTENVQDSAGVKAVVHFGFDKSNLTPEGKRVVHNVVEKIQANNMSRLVIAGHADKQGPDDYNRALSQRRANATKNEIMKKSSAIEVETQAYGSECAIHSTNAENRRVLISTGALDCNTSFSPDELSDGFFDKPVKGETKKKKSKHHAKDHAGQEASTEVEAAE